MKKNLTELVFILDKSGSMHGLEEDTIGGFNSMIEKQKNVDGQCLVSCVLFDNKSEVIFDRENINGIPEMTRKDYVPGGCTALIDALGGAIKHIGNIHKYTSGKVKKMVKKIEKESGWEFLYLATNIDAVSTGAVMGFREDRSVNYKASAKGTEHLYEAVGCALNSMRSNMAVDKCCFEQLEEDARS